jgi:hypothetical protein
MYLQPTGNFEASVLGFRQAMPLRELGGEVSREIERRTTRRKPGGRVCTCGHTKD